MSRSGLDLQMKDLEFFIINVCKSNSGILALFWSLLNAYVHFQLLQ